eukprot:Hpha_TRINITY_DN16496_c0_g14::TRINITY_DN16496_c0_g14_i2::g.162811::m.162811
MANRKVIQKCRDNHPALEAAPADHRKQSCSRCGWTFIEGEDEFVCPEADCKIRLCARCTGSAEARKLRCFVGHRLLPAEEVPTKEVPTEDGRTEEVMCMLCVKRQSDAFRCGDSSCLFGVCRECEREWRDAWQVGEDVRAHPDQKFVGIAYSRAEMRPHWRPVEYKEEMAGKVARLKLYSQKGSAVVWLGEEETEDRREWVVPDEALIHPSADPYFSFDIVQGDPGFGSKCPNGHSLQRFKVPKPGWTCDVCATAASEAGQSMWGCRDCGFDVCTHCAPIYSRCWQVGDECYLHEDVLALELACQRAGVSPEALPKYQKTKGVIGAHRRAPGADPDPSRLAVLSVVFELDGNSKGSAVDVPADGLRDASGQARAAPPVPRTLLPFHHLVRLWEWRHTGMWRSAGQTVWRHYCSGREYKEGGAWLPAEGPLCRHGSAVVREPHWGCCGAIVRSEPCHRSLAQSFTVSVRNAEAGTETPVEHDLILDAAANEPLRFPVDTFLIFRAPEEGIHVDGVRVLGSGCKDSVHRFELWVWYEKAPAVGGELGECLKVGATTGFNTFVTVDMFKGSKRRGGVKAFGLLLRSKHTPDDEEHPELSVGGLLILRTQPCSESPSWCSEGHALSPAPVAPGFVCDGCDSISTTWKNRWRCEPCDYDLCGDCYGVFRHSNVTHFSARSGIDCELMNAEGKLETGHIQGVDKQGNYNVLLEGGEIRNVFPSNIRPVLVIPEELQVLNHTAKELILTGKTVPCNYGGCRRFHTGEVSVVLDARCGTADGAACGEEGFCTHACREAWHARHRLLRGEGEVDVERHDPDWVMVHDKTFQVPFSDMQHRLRRILERDEARYIAAFESELARSPPGVVEEIGPPLWPPDIPADELKEKIRQPVKCLGEIYSGALACLVPLYLITAALGRKCGALGQPLWSLKGPRRVWKKTYDDAPEEYTNEDFSATSDIARTSLRMTSLESMARATEVLRDPAGVRYLNTAAGLPHGSLEVMRIKNRFAAPCTGGYMDVLVNVLIGEGTHSHVAEIQLHLKAVLDVKKDAGHHTYKWVRRYLRDDELKERDPDGQGKEIGAQGNVYEGDFKGGLRHGQGTYRGSEGDLYSGSWKEGKMHGKGVWSSRSHRFEGHFENGEKHGYGMYYERRAKGERLQYKGGYLQGMRHGRGEYHYGDGFCYTGEYQLGAPHGLGSLTRPDGSVSFSGLWLHGRPEVTGVANASRECCCRLVSKEGTSIQCGGCGVVQPAGSRMRICPNSCGLVLCLECAARHETSAKGRFRRLVILGQALRRQGTNPKWIVEMVSFWLLV